MTTATSGTGTITLGSAVSGYLTFALAGIADGDIIDYAIKDGANSEIGTGTYTTSGTTLTRTVTKSTNSNTAISLSGTAEVFITPRAETLAPALDFRNILAANGGLAIWQRGAGGAASIAQAASLTAYGPDRWFLVTGATQASVISQQAGLVTGSRWSARILRNSGQTGTTVMRFEYPLTVDECYNLRGQKITLQFYASSGANWSPTSGTVTVNCFFGTGTEGKRAAVAYTGETNPLTTTVNVTAGAAAAQTTFTGASAVATNVTQGCLQFSWTPVGTAGAADNLNLDSVQLEIGTTATTFETLPFGVMLRECQRHYAKTFPYATAPAQNTGLGGAAGGAGTTAPNTPLADTISWKFPVEMRATPTLTTYNPAAANTSMREVGNAVDAGTTPSGTAGTSGVYYTSTSSASAAGGGTALHIQADAGL